MNDFLAKHFFKIKNKVAGLTQNCVSNQLGKKCVDQVSTLVLPEGTIMYQCIGAILRKFQISIKLRDILP
ncbi:MAG: hypothetical protein H7240_09625 [Glaciimonas sp.]|nr:hypothetical protein [Glaciimonas sp.]